MSSMRELMEMVASNERMPSDPAQNRQMLLDMLDRVLGNQMLSKAQRAEIMETVAMTATRMAKGLRQRASD